MHKGISNTATEIALLHIKAQNYKKKRLDAVIRRFFLYLCTPQASCGMGCSPSFAHSVI